MRDARESQDALLDILERIGRFFMRLEVYGEEPPTTEKFDKLLQIVFEVLTLLEIAIRFIMQRRISECFRTIILPLTEWFLEKIWNMLIRKTDMKDAVERFDRLTREEAWMAIVKVMRAVHAIDETMAMASIEYKVIDA